MSRPPKGSNEWISKENWSFVPDISTLQPTSPVYRVSRIDYHPSPFGFSRQTERETDWLGVVTATTTAAAEQQRGHRVHFVWQNGSMNSRCLLVSPLSLLFQTYYQRKRVKQAVKISIAILLQYRPWPKREREREGEIMRETEIFFNNFSN